ncbi:MAG: T9SS type A sorting domain-containing protein, partial [Saprospiraceae bacterium]|nr:T9SS type A sorting domain-containing protein [Saprospiraceae bacterium]
GPCTDNRLIPLACGDVVSDIDLNNEQNLFSTTDLENNIYRNCSNIQNAPYDGPDVVFSLNLEMPASVTLILTGASPMGMFLYNQDCGATCQNSGEFSEAGGMATIGPIPLSGLHYLVVDKLSGAGPGDFMLSVDCGQTTLSLLSLEDGCPVSPNETHMVAVQNLDATSVVDQQAISSTDRIGFFYRRGEQEKAAAPELSWNPTTGLEFSLARDLVDIDTLKCGYDLNESFIINVLRLKNGIPQSYPVSATYVPIGTDDINALGEFIPDGISAINRLSDANVGEAKFLATDLDYQQVGEMFDTVIVRVTSNIAWTVDTDVDWISVNPNTGANFQELIILTSPNDDTTLCQAQVRIIGDNGLTRTVVIEKPKTCTVSADLQNQFSVDLFPNPVNDYLWVSTSEELFIERMTLHDVLGNSILEWNNSAFTSQLDLRFTPPGLYIIKISMGGQMVSKKILKI